MKKHKQKDAQIKSMKFNVILMLHYGNVVCFRKINMPCAIIWKSYYNWSPLLWLFLLLPIIDYPIRFYILHFKWQCCIIRYAGVCIPMQGYIHGEEFWYFFLFVISIVMVSVPHKNGITYVKKTQTACMRLVY